MIFFAGVCHGDELGYLFQMEMMSQMNLNPDVPERRVIDQLVTLWANIAETGSVKQIHVFHYKNLFCYGIG